MQLRWPFIAFGFFLLFGNFVSTFAQVNSYGHLPQSFEPNQGQTDERVKFLSRGSHHTLFLTPGETVLVLSGGSGDGGIRSSATAIAVRRDEETRKAKLETVLRMNLVQANPKTKVSGTEELPGKVNYFIGNDPKKWHTNLPTYGKVQYKEVYPGIDLVYHGDQGQLEYDFIVRPGANPRRIVLGFKGTKKLEVDPQGDLTLHTDLGVIRQRRPVVYQEINGIRREISGGYVLRGRQRVGFELGAYDPSRPLVIDPVLFYSTYLGGSGLDEGSSIAVDAAGNAYVTGLTNSTNFPTANPLQPAFGGGSFDAFVTKLNAAGSALVYSTYLGGNGDEDTSGGRIAVDSSGNAYVTGNTNSTNFPTTLGAFSRSFNGGVSDAFVTKLTSAGSALVYSTYLGGSGNDTGFGIAVDSSGNAYVTGNTNSTNFPTTPGAFQTAFGGGPSDAFVTKLNTTGSAPLLYSTYLGGSGEDDSLDIAVDLPGNAYVGGFTNSANFPTTAGAFQTASGGAGDAFVTKVGATGSAPLLYSTYLGGSGFDFVDSIAVDSSGNAYVTGATESTNFPTTSGAFQPANAGSRDAFVTKLHSTGSALVYSTYLGGSNFEEGFDIAVDSSGNAYVAGHTNSTNFPTANALQLQPAYGGGEFDAFVTNLNTAGSALIYSTYLGGSSRDDGRGIALDSLPNPNAYVTGQTNSTNFPTTAGSFQVTFGGGDFDAFVTKIANVVTPHSTTTNVSCAPSAVPVHSSTTCTATVGDTSPVGATPPSGTVTFSSDSGVFSPSASCTLVATGTATSSCSVGYTPTVIGAHPVTASYSGDSTHTVSTGATTVVAVVGPPAKLTLSPIAATNTVGATHCVTAAVTDAFGNPTPNVTVVFNVVGAQATFSMPSSGTGTTNGAGQTTFCFTAALPGENVIHAFADTNNNGMQDPGEPSGDADKIWIPPASTQFCEVTITDGGWIIADNGDRANFGGNAKVQSDLTVQGQQQYTDQGPVQPLMVKSIQVTATTCNDARTMATIFGTATINGSGMHVFRIDVTDNMPNTYGIMLDTGYMSGQHALGGGQITIH